MKEQCWKGGVNVEKLELVCQFENVKELKNEEILEINGGFGWGDLASNASLIFGAGQKLGSWVGKNIPL